ncbi:glycosyltransferase [Rhodoferax sediminis]|uniref:Glycosyltransferase n=1 Tax=Rhodoferax sediminis TaxID=2509614 RepID=A0A515DAT1_9BURK|nr:glycosyltransferase [Rhodoferax sediminis]
MKIASRRLPLKMWHRLAHRGVRSSQATLAAVDKSTQRLEHKNSDSPVRAGSPHLVVARNLEPLYDNLTAIRALQTIRASFPQVRLTIAGSGPDEHRLRQSVQDMGLTSVVQFTGRLEHDAMAALYRSADIMLNPSLADNMPNSVLEAWASGVPVVSTNVGGIPYLAQDGVTASLVPPANPAAMAQACLALLSNKTLWQQRAQAGLQEAQRYTWLYVRPVLSDVYRRAIAQPPHWSTGST